MLNEIEETEHGRAPEAMPSPAQFGIDLVDIEGSGHDRAPYAPPSPIQFGIDLVDIGDNNCAPEGVPSPVQFFVELEDIEESGYYDRVPEVPPSPIQTRIPLDEVERGTNLEVDPMPPIPGTDPQQTTATLTGSAEVVPPIHDAQSGVPEVLTLTSKGSPASSDAIEMFIFRVTTRMTDPVEICVENTRLTLEEWTDLAAALQDLFHLKVIFYHPRMQARTDVVLGIDVTGYISRRFDIIRFSRSGHHPEYHSTGHYGQAASTLRHPIFHPYVTKDLSILHEKPMSYGAGP